MPSLLRWGGRREEGTKCPLDATISPTIFCGMLLWHFWQNQVLLDPIILLSFLVPLSRTTIGKEELKVTGEGEILMMNCHFYSHQGRMLGHILRHMSTARQGPHSLARVSNTTLDRLTHPLVWAYFLSPLFFYSRIRWVWGSFFGS